VTTLGWHLLYLTAAGAVVAIEHAGLARRLEHEPVARMAMGVATVMGLALPLALAGALDLATWLWLMGGFGVCGAVTWGMYLLDAERIRRETWNHVKSKIERL
jgi:hypothetical protein